MAAPMADRSHQAKDGIQAATPDPQTQGLDQGSNLCLHSKWILNPLHLRGNSLIPCFCLCIRQIAYISGPCRSALM